jgi:5'-nucleotidase
MKPLALLSNDDGVEAHGLHILREVLSESMDVVVCAPTSEQSGTSHAITLNRPLRLVEHAPGVFSVDGTPADCVYVALHSEGRVLPRRPDVVLSGINHGLNLGNDVFYSGTVAAAREGALKGHRGLALSASLTTDLTRAAEVARDLALSLIRQAAPERALYNVNFPPGDHWTLAATSLGSRRYGDGVLFRKDPRGGEYLWVGTGDVHHERLEGTDTCAYDQGVIGVTPLSLELWAATQADRTEALLAGLGRE